MAVIAVAALANAGGWGFWTTTAAMMAASYVDSAYIMPAIFPQKGATIHGARVDDFNIQHTNEGTPINRCFGPECRIPATIIWMAGKGKKADWEIVRKHNSKGAKYYTYHYYADVAIGLCEGEIVDVLKIWADGKLIWNKQTDIAQSNSSISAAAKVVRKAGVPTTYMDISSPDGGPNLRLLKSGVDVVIGGFTSPATANNGTFKCIRSWSAGGGVTKARLANTAAVTKSAGDAITIYQAVPAAEKGLFRDVRIYKGTEEQEPDTLIESYEGAGNVPAFRGLAYVMLEHFYLADFGNRLPNIEVLVDAI